MPASIAIKLRNDNRQPDCRDLVSTSIFLQCGLELSPGSNRVARDQAQQLADQVNCGRLLLLGLGPELA